MSNVKISNGEFIMYCLFHGKQVEFVMTNLDESYIEKLNFEDIMERVKELNKRIKFDDIVVRSTLQNSEPLEVNWFDIDGENKRGLRLKYQVGKCPFHIKWNLQKQTEREIRNTIMLPLFKTIQGMSEQIEELSEVLRRKDIEIAQYKSEGAVLRRVTVATKRFDFDSFHDRYEETKALEKRLQPIGKYLQDNVLESTPIVKNNDVNNDIPAASVYNCSQIKNQQSTTNNNAKLLKSPKNRKRQVMAKKHTLMERQLMSRKQKLEYESSQNLSQSSVELVEISTDTTVDSDKRKLRKRANETSTSVKQAEQQDAAKQMPKSTTKKTKNNALSDSDSDKSDTNECTTSKKIKHGTKSNSRWHNRELYISDDEETVGEKSSPVSLRKNVQPSSQSSVETSNSSECLKEDIVNIYKNLNELNKKSKDDLNRRQTKQ